MLNDGRRGTLQGVLHILGLARNFISISTREDVGVWTMFEKHTCKMVQGAMVLMRGIMIGTVYKLLGKLAATVVIKWSILRLMRFYHV